MKYSIIKAILVYHPRKVMEAMYRKPEDFVNELRAFFIERINLNEENIVLKERENIAFKQILLWSLSKVVKRRCVIDFHKNIWSGR